MGCFSSKSTGDEQLEDNKKGASGSKKAANAEEIELSWIKKAERCATDDDFANAVEEALRLNSELITCNEFKRYISSRYTCEADESFQDEIIHKVIGEQFVKGSLAVKLV